jgi:uncharacterized protein YecT (DUF1311 family)
MRIIIFFLLFVYSLLANEYVQREECISDSGIPPMDCFSSEYEYYDHELNRLYTIQIEHLQEPNKTRLKEAQRAWINFRDKDCAYSAGPQSEGGSLWYIEYSGCMIARTKNRIRELDFYVKCRENGCPE